MKNLFENLVNFHKRAEKLKATTRHSWLSEVSRQESVAEHSWMLTLLAMLLADKIETKIDLLKVMKMLTIHDLGEAVTGDIPSHEISVRQESKYEVERKAYESILEGLPKENAEEIVALWEEFEKKETPESKFANALDKIEALMQHNVADIKTWEQGDFNVGPYYKNNLFDFDSFMRGLKDLVDNQTLEKVVEAGLESRVDAKHWETYKKRNS